jgi:hypothetical protein
MRTFKEFLDICEGSEIAGRLADLAQRKANNLFQGNRQWDPYRAKIQTLTRIADLAGARSSDKPEPRYAGMTLSPPGGGGKPANLPPSRPINSRGGAGDRWSKERDRGNKDQRLLDFVSGRRDNPNMSARERTEKDRNRGKPKSSRGGGGSTSRSGNAGTSSGNILPRSASERSGLPRSFRPGAAGSGDMMAN